MTGTYRLVDVNGYGVPGVFTNQPANNRVVTATSGAVTLTPDGTYNNRMDFTVVYNGVTTDSISVCTGTYSTRGNEAIFSTSAPGCPTGVRAVWDYQDGLSVDYGLVQRTRYAR
ncbi:MAG TPA: hypothetical protein VF761_01740 [Gemmatimonadaceae bacterium]